MSLAIEQPIKPGTPDPYEPPAPGEWGTQTTLQIGPITQFVTSLVHANGNGVVHEPDYGLQHQRG